MRWLNIIAKTPLLIIDDFGLQPLISDMRLALLQILEDRFAKGATIVTSQLPVAKFEVLPPSQQDTDASTSLLTTSGEILYCLSKNRSSGRLPSG